LLCQRCHHPVKVSRDQFDVFERVVVLALAQLRALHVDSLRIPALTATVGKDPGPGKLQTPETVKHHLKPFRQRSVGTRQPGRTFGGSAFAPDVPTRSMPRYAAGQWHVMGVSRPVGRVLSPRFP